MQSREKKLEAIIEWAKANDDVRVVLLTSSLANPLAPVDEFSDLDIEVVFEHNTSYVTDNHWVSNFGRPIAMIEKDERDFDGLHAMKMVLYDDYVKVDFKLYSKAEFLQETDKNELPEDWDIGYKIMIDKDGITRRLKKPGYQVSIIKKPSEPAFEKTLNDFWWDVTYVAKCLARDDMFYAKFMAENIRTDYLTPLIEWYIACGHHWNVTTNKHGRLFRKYLPGEMWEKIEQTFSGYAIADNWIALLAMADVVSAIGTELSEKLGYPYPTQLETDIRKYLSLVRATYPPQHPHK